MRAARRVRLIDLSGCGVCEVIGRSAELYCAQPFYRILQGESVYEFFIGGNQLCLGGFRQRDVEAIIETASKRGRDVECTIQQGKGRNRRKVTVGDFQESNPGIFSGYSLSPGSLPKHISDFRPEEIWYEDLNLFQSVAVEQLERMFRVWLIGRRQDPLASDARVHHSAFQRSRSSRIISSVEGK